LARPADEPEKRLAVFDAIVAECGSAVSLLDRARLGSLVQVYENEKGFEDRVKAVRARLPSSQGK
jgi:hypothetical protein